MQKRRPQVSEDGVSLLVFEEAQAVSSDAECIESPVLVMGPITMRFVVSGVAVDVIRALTHSVKVHQFAAYFLARPVRRICA